MIQRTSWSWCSYLAVAVVRRGRVRADGRVVGGRDADDGDATDGRAAREAPRAFEDRIFAWRCEVR